MHVTRFAASIEPVVNRWVPVVVFAALPTLGLAAGPSYAALIFGLAGLQLLIGLGMGRGFPAIDRTLAALAGMFLLLCWASVAWSIVPSDTARAAGQETGIFLASLVVCAHRGNPEGLVARLFQVLLVACLVGIAVACLDIALGHRLEALISGKPRLAPPSKYNRGLDYLALIMWPVLAYAWWRRWWWRAGLLVVAVAAAQAMGLSLAGRMAFLVGLLALLLASVLPRLVRWLFALGMGVFVAGLPFALRVVTARRAEFTPYLKPSGLHRLEISNYMTARVFERPLLGWGLLSAKSVPIHPAELAHYIYVDPRGVYPHDQWLELWVELGAVGAALGLAFVWLVLRRIGRMPLGVRPFAYAALAAALAIAGVNYEITTDSWWAALAATAALFMMLGREMANASGAGRTA